MTEAGQPSVGPDGPYEAWLAQIGRTIIRSAEFYVGGELGGVATPPPDPTAHTHTPLRKARREDFWPTAKSKSKS